MNQAHDIGVAKLPTVVALTDEVVPKYSSFYLRRCCVDEYIVNLFSST